MFEHKVELALKNKIYRDANAGTLKIRQKEYQAINKDRINENRKKRNVLKKEQKNAEIVIVNTL